jgi:pantoate--beta-alanine ligase
MLTITHPAEAADWSASMRKRGIKVGFVPTMGALHEGHISLIDRAKADGTATAASIFVNPLQFNDPDDLKRYPRQPEKDRELLQRAGCSMLFMPTAEAIYSGHAARTYDLGGLDQMLEGPLRPGHFQGVVNVVERLFHYVRPDRAYFGEKDRQQLAVIRHVAAALHWPEEIIGCPTQREANGLAMSSRNQRLSPVEREKAGVLYRALKVMEASAFDRPVGECLERGKALLNGEPLVSTEYLVIADTATLRPVQEWEGRSEAVALVAARFGPVRLIDNITLRR